MKSLHIKDNIKNFLYDFNDCISLYDGHIYIFNYSKLNKLSEKNIIVSFAKYKINVTGANLKIKKMTKQELLINGVFTRIDIEYV